MSFETRQHRPETLSIFAIRVTSSCLGVLKLLDPSDAGQLTVIRSILKKCLRISQQLSNGPAMTRKLLESQAALKVTHQDMLTRLMQGLMLTDNTGLDYSNLRLRYNFLA